jgi:predicted ester cyclase
LSKSRKGITQMQMIIVAAVVVVAVAAGVYYYMSMQMNTPTATEQANMALARNMWETVNRGDINALDPFYASNYKRHMSLASPPLNSTQQKQRLTGLHAAFSNFNLTVVNMVAKGDFVAARLTFTGTQTGTFQGIPPTGKTGKIIFLEEVRIVDGKVVDHWGGPDWSDMLKQLGVKFTPGP